ncbi:hypothetical protein LOCC1_G002725 [Lachnellula occidentalis]|uniref:Glutamyl-tRNA amidotransferase complex subunit Gta3 domain-containing protein n=1 Tax=Lachnellula occidentalis TaxID=215460 RepID=A0A8H8S441_9HELO|nr:hypothetical protein LOCC1_G002725 [Lachnellula occidentalis]
MSAFICRSCRASQRTLRRYGPQSTRAYSSLAPPMEPQDLKAPKQPIDVEALLSKPTWSVKDLIPSNEVQPIGALRVKPEQLHHLLRLSALPMPKSPEEEEKMLRTLDLQLHFVRKMQIVDTEGVEPLQSIRDETTKGREEATIGLEELRDALGKEDIKGRSRRPRRRREVIDTEGVEDWDVLGTASEKIETPGGKYFVVRSGKAKEESE